MTSASTPSLSVAYSRQRPSMTGDPCRRCPGDHGEVAGRPPRSNRREDQGLHLIYRSFGPPASICQRAGRSVHPFWHSSWNIVSLYFTIGRKIPLKLLLPLGTFESPPNTWFVGLTQVHVPYSRSIGSTVLAEFMFVANRHSHRHVPWNTSDNRPHLMLCV